MSIAPQVRASPEAPASAGRVVCLGEALVDLVCEGPVAGLGEASAFVPRPGGSLANIAVVAARFGARASLLGGAGSDEWGRWLRERIAAEGVDVSRFRLVEGSGTSHAFVTVSEGGEPSFAFYEAAKRPVAEAAPDLEAALAGVPGVVVLGSDTLLSSEEREVSARAAELAGRRGWAVLVDPNLRPARWPGEREMLDAVGFLLDRAAVVKCNAAEARALTGERDSADAAQALLARGPVAAALTRGPEGALLARRGAGVVRMQCPRPVAVVDATGAGDAVAGVLAAALATAASAEELEAPLRLALRVAAGVIAAPGATAGLPPDPEARAALATTLAEGRPPSGEPPS